MPILFVIVSFITVVNVGFYNSPFNETIFIRDLVLFAVLSGAICARSANECDFRLIAYGAFGVLVGEMANIQWFYEDYNII